MPLLRARPMATAIALALLPAAVLADSVSVRIDATPGPFPSDRYTVRDWSQNTFRRVRLPKPDCAVRPSDCADIDVINELDGFSTQPRITIPFTGDIDPASVTSQTVFLINLGDTLTLRGFGQRVGINQVVWDPATKTLAVESDELLEQHSRYVLIVTDGVRDTKGKRIKPAKFDDDSHDRRRGLDTSEYHRDLRDATRLHRGHDRIVAATLFTTQSTTADLRKVMKSLKQSTPAPVDFMIASGANGPQRALFAVNGIAGLQLNRQVGTAPAFASPPVPVAALGVAPGAVGQIAYGRFSSPDYQNAAKVIPTTPTRAGWPQPQGTNSIALQLFLPSGPKPAGGWPVAVFGHGFTDSLFGAPWTVAATLASRGIATASINVVGHGGGPLTSLTVTPTAGAPVTVPVPGRGIDQDGNGSIDSTEGVNAAPPRTIVGSRDGLRQTVVDLMQLVRQVQSGIDVDGDGSTDLDGQRIYYAGQSFGGIYGTILLGVEPDLRAGVPNVPGGSITEVARLGGFRGLTGVSLATRTPSLINVVHPSGVVFNENIPLRDLPPVVNTVPGAMAIAEVLDRFEWVQQSGNPVSYAPYIRKQPFPGQAAKPVIFQVAKGDATVPNPTSTAIIRAGDLADRMTWYRHDLAYAANPALPKNPHTFLTNVASPAAAPYAVGAQIQMAVFFATNGTTTIDPDAGGPIFEVPIAEPLPERLNFIP